MATPIGCHMSVPPHGPWDPLSVDDLVEVFSTAPFTWYVAGGHALELAVGRSWREHDDIDVGVRRDEVPAVHAHLADEWELYVAAAGELTRWDGGGLAADRHQNNIWARRASGGPWKFDITVGAGTDEVWRSRRDPSIEVPWTVATPRHRGTPYLAPHLQLLMKSKAVREKDDLDAKVVVPALRPTARGWLAERLDAAHPWQRLIRQADERAAGRPE